MPRFRKRPVEIEAWLIEDLMWAFKNGALPEDVAKAHERGDILFSDAGLHVRTLEGTMRGNSDAFLLKGVQGEFYTCAPAIFDATYDAVSETKKKHDGPCWRQSTTDCGC